MNKLDELLKLGWKIELNIGMGRYFIYASHWDYAPIDVEGNTLKSAVNELCRRIENK